MLLERHAELILPSLRENRCAGCLWLFTFLEYSLIDFCGRQIKRNQILVIRMDNLAEQLIPIIRVPV